MPDELNEEALLTPSEQYVLARNKALTLLARREYSEFELRHKIRHLADDSVVERVIADLIGDNLQSDERFAEMICRSRFNQGKGPVKLLHELNQNQISHELISEAMAPYEHEWRKLAKQVREKKFGSEPIESYQQWAKQARFLQQRGFDASHFDGFDG